MSEQPAGSSGVAWAGIALICACALLCAVLELFLVPLYAGSVLVPVAVLFAVASNIGLPLLAKTLVPRAAAVVAPFAAWLVGVFLLGLLPRPEGDVVLPGSPGSLELVGYGVMLGGALAGTITIVMSTGSPLEARPATRPGPPRPARPSRPPRPPRPPRPSGPGRSGKNVSR